MVVRLVFIRIRKYWIGGSSMGKMKEKYHYAISNEISVYQYGKRSTSMYESIIWYCCQYFQLEGLDIEVKLYDNYDSLKCWGDSAQVSDTEYTIRICTDQPLRDVVATVCHEMVHVNQWVTNEWSGDGEKEAEKLQYKMADKFWKGWE